jgi:L-alanine-DL-glutamate epimerase-like enolase superfamily enzyme
MNDSMNITRIHLYMVNVPERHWWWSDDTYGQPLHQRAEHGVAEVETDQGLTGLTQIEQFTPMETVETMLNSWLGQNILEINLSTASPGSLRQVVLDLRGQALGVPIWQLLGGRLRQSIPVTQCTGYKTPEHTAADAQWGWEHGFRAYKMKCITQREETPEQRIRYVTDRVEAIHRVLPEMAVRPDIRWRLEEVWVAQELARRLQGHAIESLESPIANGAAGGTFSEWRRLRQTIHLPIGDHVSGSEDLLRRFQAEALDYAIVESLEDSHLAHQLGMGGWSQTVSYGPGAAMGLHDAACMPHLSQPYDMVGPMAWEHTLVNEDFPFEDGAFVVSDRPGLGYTLDHAAVAQYLVEKRVFEKE